MSDDTRNTQDLRAGDAERDRVAKLLQDHFAQGRLDAEEFGARLESAYKARTRRDLDTITEDLPERDLAAYVPPPPPRQASGARRSILRDPALLIPWGLYAGVNTLCFTIWLILFLTGEVAYPWFLWVLGPWGIIMVFVTIALAAVQRTGHDGA